MMECKKSETVISERVGKEGGEKRMIGRTGRRGGWRGEESNQPVAPPGAPFTVCLSPWPDSGTAPVWEEPSKVSPLLPPAAHHHAALLPPLPQRCAH